MSDQPPGHGDLAGKGSEKRSERAKGLFADECANCHSYELAFKDGHLTCGNCGERLPSNHYSTF